MAISDLRFSERNAREMHPLGVFALFIGALLAPVDYFIVNLALPQIGNGLHESSNLLGLVISAYAIAYAVWLIPGGQLGDKYGRKRVFLIGMGCFVIASMICGMAPNIFLLIFGRFLQGLSAATFLPQVLATIRTVLPWEKQTRLISLYGFIFGVGAIVGQIGGGLLVSANIAGTSWRSIFFINVPIGLIAIVLTCIFGVENTTRTNRSLDGIGCILVVCAVSAMLIPISVGSHQQWSVWTFWVFILGAGLAVVTIFFEKFRGNNALINIKLFSRPVVSRGLIIGFLFYTDSIFFMGFSFYMQEGLHWSALHSSILFCRFL